MNHFLHVLTALFLAAGSLSSFAETAKGTSDSKPVATQQKLQIEAAGLTREALVYARPEAVKEPAPLVFVFHGHGGNAAQASRSIRIHELWPEAIVVYPQGLPTPGHLTDKEGKRNGWQKTTGDQNDRDFAFFDALLARLKKDYAVDSKHIFSTGHSNGGAFTYLLWETRRDIFSAFAPSGAADPRALQLKPAPALHVAGENDPLVRYAWQAATMRVARKVNGCDAEGKSWGDHATIYESANGTPFITWIHPGGHEYPAGASEAIVRFFKSQK